jgi:hypothetical protein
MDGVFRLGEDDELLVKSPKQLKPSAVHSNVGAVIVISGLRMVTAMETGSSLAAASDLAFWLRLRFDAPIQCKARLEEAIHKFFSLPGATYGDTYYLMESLVDLETEGYQLTMKFNFPPMAWVDVVTYQLRGLDR